MAHARTNTQPETPPQRRNRTAPVGSDAALAGTAALARAGFADPTIVLRWEEIVGPEVARIAHPIRLTEGASGATLTLISEPAASVFLQHETRSLCGRINAYIGRDAVKKLRFVSGNLRKRPSPRANPQIPASVPETDPARRFQGRDTLQDALIALARARRAATRNLSD